jgi:hypothetical protein
VLTQDLQVHVEDLARLFIFVAKRALSSDASKDATPYSKFYFAVAARHAWGEVTRRVGDILFARKLVDAPGAISITAEDENKLIYTASTGRTISDRAYGLGWKPTKASLEESLEADVDEVLKKV